MATLRLLLRDREPALCAELATAFEGIRAVEVSCGDIFDVTADAIVSPANSFGFMDGGIDLAYSRRFGWGLQARVREVLHDEHGGELPVGQAIVVATGDEVIRWLVCAPTMRVPDNVAESVNAYLAMRAALRAVRAFDAGAHPIESVLCPGLATAVGRMPFPRAALQMRAGFDAVMNALPPFVSLGQAKDAHFALLRTPQR